MIYYIIIEYPIKHPNPYVKYIIDIILFIFIPITISPNDP